MNHRPRDGGGTGMELAALVTVDHINDKQLIDFVLGMKLRLHVKPA